MSDVPAASEIPDGLSIDIEDLTKIYNEGKPNQSVAIKNASLQIKAGEFISFLGPSGCGKTTLLRILAGLIAPTTGTVTFAHGTDRREPRPQEHGIVLQNSTLLPWLNVTENILLPTKIWGEKREKYLPRAQELIRLMKVERAAKFYPGQLSGGMQQRVSIARALIHSPKLIYMDEPFGALDAMTREELNQELSKIHQLRRPTILFVTHDINEAVFLSDRIVVFSNSPARVVGVQETRWHQGGPRDRYDLPPSFALEVKTVREVLNRAENERKEG